MAYIPALSETEIISSVHAYKKFFVVSTIFIVLVVVSIPIFKSFWDGKIIWGTGSLLALFSAISHRYFDIKKKSNKRNVTIEIKNFSASIQRWLRIEKFVSYLWLLGSFLLVISKWTNF